MATVKTCGFGAASTTSHVPFERLIAETHLLTPCKTEREKNRERERAYTLPCTWVDILELILFGWGASYVGVCVRRRPIYSGRQSSSTFGYSRACKVYFVALKFYYAHNTTVNSSTAVANT